MFGEPEDVPDDCNARLYIADNYGDNSSTFRCQREPDHEGLHRETFDRAADGETSKITIEWERDERKKCDHGCGQWAREHYDPDVCPKHAVEHDYNTCAFCHPNEESTVCTACGTLYYGSQHHRCEKGQPAAVFDANDVDLD